MATLAYVRCMSILILVSIFMVFLTKRVRQITLSLVVTALSTVGESESDYESESDVAMTALSMVFDMVVGEVGP